MIEIEKVKKKWTKIIYEKNYSGLDDNIRSNLNGLFHIILSLISEKILEEEIIDYMLVFANSNMDEIHNNLSNDYFIIISSEILTILEELELECNDLELYESSANIKSFYRRFWNHEE